MLKKQVIPYSKKQKEEYAILPDILYEIEMLLFPFDSYDKRRDEPKLIENQKRLKVALLESQLLHARNLLDFFTSIERSRLPKDEQTLKELPDVLTTDFNGMRAPLINREKGLKARLDKTLAHISYDRISYKQKNDIDWPPVIFLPVLKGCQIFLDHLRNNLLDECTEEDRQKIPVLADVTADTIKQVEKSNEASKATFNSMAAVTTNAPVHVEVFRPDGPSKS